MPLAIYKGLKILQNQGQMSLGEDQKIKVWMGPAGFEPATKRL